MHIDGLMRALRISGLDHMAKMAVVIVAAHADYPAGAAAVSIGRLASDLEVNYTTAWRALERAVETDILGVEKVSGKTPIWRLTYCTAQEVTSCAGGADLLHSARGPLEQIATKELLDLDKGNAAAAPDGAGAGDKPSRVALEESRAILTAALARRTTSRRRR